VRAIEEDLWHVMDGAVFDSSANINKEEQDEGGVALVPPFLAGDEVFELYT
jgi:hypothetical protein